METVERDPRVDPRPGDVLLGKNEGDGSPCKRTVLSVTPLGNIFYRQQGWGRKELLEGPKQWRKWAATAEVVPRGEA